jgi:hypothetical protein
MSNNTSKKDNTLEELANLSTGGSVQEQMAAMQLEEMQERRAEKQAKKAVENAARLATLRDIQVQEANKAAAQAGCPHMKPNFQPALGGQKDHKGNYHLLCQYCQKEFSGETLPPHLRLPAEMIGGPQ